MTQTYDYAYHYQARHAPCRIRTYEANEQTICLATQRQDRFGGAALSENVPGIATQVEAWHHPIHDGRFVWVEQYELRGADPEGRWETFAFVTFQRDDADGLGHPVRRSTDRAAVEGLIGQAVGA